MNQSWAELMKKADANSRSAAEELKEAQKRREKLKLEADKNKTINNAAIQMILERRRKEQELAARKKQEQETKRTEVKDKPAKPAVPQKNDATKKDTTKPEVRKDSANPVKPASVKKPAPPPLSFQDIMKAAELNAAGKPLPKDLANRINCHKVKKTVETPKPSTPPPTNSMKNVSKTKIDLNKNNQTKTTKNLSQPTNSTATKNRASSLPATKPTINRNNANENKIKSSSASSSSSLKATQKPVPSKTNSTKVSVESTKTKATVSNNKPMNTSRTPMTSVSATSNGNRTALSNGNKPTVNGQSIRNSLPMNRSSTMMRPKKRPALDTDDEDDEDLRDFIVNDDDHRSNFDYKKELHETLRRNFRFDPDKYRSRVIYDDDDDIDNMESSFDQIEREEEYSRRMGLKEDIEDIMREEAEKKRSVNQLKKRTKTS